MSFRNFSFFFLLIFFVPGSLFALNNSFSFITLRPSLTPSPQLSVAPSRTLKKHHLFMSSTLDYSYKPLVATSVAGIKTDVVPQAAVMHLGGGYGLTDRVSLGLEVPVVLLEQFHQLGQPDTDSKIGFGDIRLEVPWQIYESRFVPEWGIGLRPFLLVPTGYGRFYMSSDQVVSGGAVLAMDRRFQKITLTGNLGGQVNRESRLGDLPYDDQFLVAGAASYSLDKKWTLFLEGEGRTLFDDFFQSQKSSAVEIRGGSHFAVSREWDLFAAAGHGFLKGIGTPLF
ncbi:MAG: transporter, partial [bacterium]|nr:transporter [bacterium]